uniref:ribosomal protein L23 n=1 Tax=Juncus bufonius TaxID=223656 RepID=UPI001F128F73|nr:ribosomal protein L23 [Juncus bufonius]YP_010291095.1 ribosomal protein L23 [Juncus bufonius]ULQ66651.1 ribosomal protein L23 [Juncus bufonius]ULQ66685.1 ribosomal protein L23 [Juncus bufonius]
METFNKSIEMGSVSMESRHPYRMDKSNIFIVNYIYIESGSTKPETLCRTLLWSEGIR